MFFEQALTIPANTPIEDPASVVMRVTEGTVQRVWVRWRWGSGNLCGARMLHNTFQYWPLTLGGWFPSSAYPLEFEDYTPIAADSRLIYLEGYNLDEIYPHTVWVAVNIVRDFETQAMRQFIQDIQRGG